MAHVHGAAERNDVEALRALLDINPELVEADLEWDNSKPLHRACQEGAFEAARLLLDRGAGVNRQDEDGETALSLACESGLVEVVGLLLARGADPCIRDGYDSTALIQASIGSGHQPCSDHVTVVRLLLEDGRVPVDAANRDGRTALWEACRYGHTEKVRLLLMQGKADPTIPDANEETPAAVAERFGHEGCVQLLQWYEGELERVDLLTKARAVFDHTESITNAAERAGAQTEAQAQKAREETAPAYMQGRVVRGEALPVVELVGRPQATEQEEVEEEEEEERGAVLEGFVRMLNKDLCWDLLEGLRFR